MDRPERWEDEIKANFSVAAGEQGGKPLEAKSQEDKSELPECTCTFRLQGCDDDHHQNKCAVTLWHKRRY